MFDKNSNTNDVIEVYFYKALYYGYLIIEYMFNDVDFIKNLDAGYAHNMKDAI